MKGDKPFILKSGRWRLKFFEAEYGDNSRHILLEYNLYIEKLDKWLHFQTRIYAEDLPKLKELLVLFENNKKKLLEGGFL